MEVFLTTACPECGAAGRHKEGIITFKCPYCASVLRVKEGGAPHKYIIPRRVADAEIPSAVKRAIASGKAVGLTRLRRIFTAYKPFWYFKGMVFYSHAGEKTSAMATGGIRSNMPEEGQRIPTQRELNEKARAEPQPGVIARLWSHTFQANADVAPSLFTLGIQSEVLQLEPYDSETHSANAHIVPATVTREEAEKSAAAMALNSVNVERTQYRYSDLSLIGERYAIIYYPIAGAVCESKEGHATVLLDGVNKNFIACVPGSDPSAMLGASDPSPFRLAVLSHRCPNCGADLEPGDFDLSFYCRNCFSLWLLEGDNYRPLKKKTVDPRDAPNPVFMPFWRFTVTVESARLGVSASTVGDLAKLIKAGDLLLRNERKENPIRFYVPAVVAKNATAMLKLSARISQAQKDMPTSELREFPYGNFRNASLPEREAREMLPALAFSVIGRSDRKALELYGDMRVTGKDAELVWYPFSDENNMLADRYLNFNVAKRGLEAALF